MTETIKEILSFCNSAIFYDYKNLGVITELKKVRKCVINTFHKKIPSSRILTNLSNIDDMILKINDNDVDDILVKFHDLREIVLFRIGFENLVREEKVEYNINE